MTKTQCVFNRVLSIVCAVALILGCVLIFSGTKVSAAETEVTVTNSEIMAGIYNNTADRTFSVKNGEDVLGVFTAGYGVIGSDEKAFDNYESATFFHHVENGAYWFLSSSPDSQYNYWQVAGGAAVESVFLKLEVKQDCALTLGHDAISNAAMGGNGDGYDFSIEAIRVRDGSSETLSSVSSGNTATEFAANSLLNWSGDVKTGDVIYVAVTGDWSGRTHFNPVFTFTKLTEDPAPSEGSEPGETDEPMNVIVGNSEIMAGIYNNTADRTFSVKNGEDVLGIFTAGYGVIGSDEKAFDDYESATFFHHVEDGAYWFLSSSPDSQWNYWKVASGEDAKSVFLKLEVKQDCALTLGHETIDNAAITGGNGDGYDFFIEVIRVRGGASATLSSKASGNTATEFEANSLLNWSGDVKTGDVIYVAVTGDYEARTHFNPVFTFAESEDEPGVTEQTPINAAVNNSEIMAGIYNNRTDRTYSVMHGEDVLGVFTAGYGVIGSDERAFDNYESATFFQHVEDGAYWFLSSSPDSQWYYWKAASGGDVKSVFLKLEVKQDCCLTLGHEAIDNTSLGWGENAAGYDFTVQAIRVRNGVKTTLSSRDSGDTALKFDANSLLNCAYNVKAGDVIYVAVTGDYEARTHFNPVFTFTDTDPAAQTGDQMSMLPVVILLLAAAGLICTVVVSGKYRKA